MGSSYTRYMTSYDGICQVVRIPDACHGQIMANKMAIK
jgi:hypothetical protein